MENLILVGQMFLCNSGKSIGFNFVPPRKSLSSPMRLKPRANVSEISNGMLSHILLLMRKLKPTERSQNSCFVSLLVQNLPSHAAPICANRSTYKLRVEKIQRSCLQSS